MIKKTIAKLLICAMIISLLPKTNYAQEDKVNTATVTEKENSKTENAEKKEEVKKEVKAEQKEEKKETQNSAKEEKREEKKEEKTSEKKSEEATAKVRKRRDANNYQGTVTFVGQWTGESRQKEDSTRNFTNADEKLGKPLDNPGLFRGVAKTFLGWSDKAPVGNGKLADGARLFSTEDKISTAFPGGLPADAKLYGVYFSLNNPDAPLSEGYLMGLDILAGIGKMKMEGNKTSINEDKSAEDILPGTALKEEKTEGTTRKIVDLYEKKDDINKINEVVVNSEFKTDPTIAMLVYKNPHVGYVGPVFTNTYKDNEFKTDDGKTGYTYVDIVMNIDQNLTVPEKLYFEFEGYTWRPLYVMGANRQPLNVINPSNDANLGNTKDSFKTLVYNTNPKVKFGVETNNNKTFIIRMVIRTGDEKIEESSITPVAGKTIAETILQKMKLKVLSKADLPSVLAPGKTDEDLNKNVLKISDAKAKELGKTDGATTLNITGYIKGNTVANGGKLSFLTLKSENELKKADANTIALGYFGEKYSVTPEFVSGTAGKTLPNGVLNQLPNSAIDVPTGFKYPLKTDFNPVVDNGGTWNFKKWQKVNADGSTTDVTTEVEVGEEDVKLQGVWEFVADPVVEKYNIIPNHVSETPGKDITAVEQRYTLPITLDAGVGQKYPLQVFNDVRVADGTWKFQRWEEVKADGTRTVVENEAEVKHENLVLEAIWKFVEDSPVNKYNIYHSFKSGTEANFLPTEVLRQKPINVYHVVTGYEHQLKTDFDDVEVDDGIWKFSHWEVKNADGTFSRVNDKVTVADSNIQLRGIWKLERKETPKLRVYHSFESITDGKTLPVEVFTKIPADELIKKGLAYRLPSFNPIEVADGTWKPVRWSSRVDGERNVITGDEYVVNEPTELILSWKFIPKGEVEKFDVRYSFESATAGKTLPQEVFTQIPKDKVAELNSKLTLPLFNEVKVDGGTWKPVKWTMKANGNSTEVTGNEVTIKDDTDLILSWEFVADVTPQPNPQPQNPENPQKPGKKLPKTNISSGLSYVLTSLLALGAMGTIGYKKKDNE